MAYAVPGTLYQSKSNNKKRCRKASLFVCFGTSFYFSHDTLNLLDILERKLTMSPEVLFRVLFGLAFAAFDFEEEAPPPTPGGEKDDE